MKRFCSEILWEWSIYGLQCINRPDNHIGVLLCCFDLKANIRRTTAMLQKFVRFTMSNKNWCWGWLGFCPDDIKSHDQVAHIDPDASTMPLNEMEKTTIYLTHLLDLKMQLCKLQAHWWKLRWVSWDYCQRQMLSHVCLETRILVNKNLGTRHQSNYH